MGKLGNLTELALRVREEVRISDVIGADIQLRQSGHSHKGICPFHGDRTLGSFVVTDSKGIFKCFSCGVGGDAIKYVAMRQRVSNAEAITQIAAQFGLISESDATVMGKQSFSFSELREIQPEATAMRASRETIHLVYGLFQKGMSYLRKPRLSEAHRAHLRDERGLSEALIERNYFTFPTRYVMKYLLQELEELGHSASLLEGVPGFFCRVTESGEEWDFAVQRGGGIGILLRDAEGYIVAIQIRRNTVEPGQQRYVWFSSSFATSGKRIKGTSSKSPVDVIYPEEIKTKSIFITEGHFKAQAIASTFGAIAVSVQGICAWSPVSETIRAIRKARPDVQLNYIYVAYDGDMAYNINVFQQAITMGAFLGGLPTDIPESEKLGMEVIYCLWDCDFGKGIDDVIQNGHVQNLRKIELEDLLMKYQSYIRRLVTEVREHDGYQEVRDIPAEVKKALFFEEV